ncbi:hypothetical protein CIW53_04615 [Rhodanobacter sp. T12-5]|nr:hypothetical protein CIW53_04615 [Rhodanobacter sp. T12-5]
MKGWAGTHNFAISQGEVQLALVNTQIDPEVQAAIIAKDQEKLEALLGGSTVSCVFFCDDNDERESETDLKQCA